MKRLLGAVGDQIQALHDKLTDKRLGAPRQDYAFSGHPAVADSHDQQTGDGQLTPPSVGVRGCDAADPLNAEPVNYIFRQRKHARAGVYDSGDYDATDISVAKVPGLGQAVIANVLQLDVDDDLTHGCTPIQAAADPSILLR